MANKKSKLDAEQQKVLQQRIYDLSDAYGLEEMRKAWNRFYKSRKERESLLRKKREAEEALRKIDAELTP